MTDLDHAIWWHVYPLGACGAPIRPGDPGDWQGHRLGRLEAWLDYVIELGCNGLLLGPIFASTSHGYDTVDHFRLDPRLGDEADWNHLVDQAHSRGLMIMLDGVFNHIGAQHPLVEQALQGHGMVHVADGVHRGWEGHGDLAELDHDDPRVVDLVADVMKFWLDRGADGWRLDVAYAVPSHFWTQVVDRVHASHPEAFFLGEVIHGDFPGIAREGHLDSVTAYELWKAIWSSLNDRNMWELAWALERHDDFASKTTMQTFIGNHDVSRIASTVGDTGAAVAAALLLTLPGMPSIYYGDEQAFRGTKGTGVAADDPVRPPLPEHPGQLHPGGEWMHRLHQELIALRRRNPWISTGRLQVLDKTNPTISYAVRAEGHELTAHLDISEEPRIEVTIDGQQQFSWPQ
ncbi:alpha-amylase family protein [Aestuariimicrobium sp. p3-SID1156]|uniref:alpha-amylase family protein n=1 Tax=Aestuariimicrobium sp. p3-SID1156 TaxID=2916038 RepID=UPI00223BD69A|nr:alpha-amylase family protein [Aestuariimicrobium sp. p3-SID1156]MCT1459998.1 alpha-amylase family protein [Aestuariimicrobium sp. p3-SID1156]